MKAKDINDMIEVGAYIAGAYFLTSAFFGWKKRKLNEESVEGIGATKPKRRIWNEVQRAQEAGIDLTDPSGWKGHEAFLAQASNGKLSRSTSSKSDEERYFGQLRRAYRSIAGTSLPRTQSVVRNEYGDVILVYNDYHLDQLPQRAAEWTSQQVSETATTDPYTYGYWVTIAAIAIGSARFIWKGTKDKVHRGVEELIFGASAPAERKQRISYIVSASTRNKYPRGAAMAGKYPEEWAHGLWEGTDGQADIQLITDGVLDAIRNCYSVGQAQEMCVSEYLKAHQVSEPKLDEDVPF